MAFQVWTDWENGELLQNLRTRLNTFNNAVQSKFDETDWSFGSVTGTPLSSDPSDPAVGASVMWTSDGTGSGDEGDVMVKVNVGGTVKVITLVDYSAN